MLLTHAQALTLPVDCPALFTPPVAVLFSGVLLSGGLDSSLVAAIAARAIKSADSVWGNRLHSFCVGLAGSPDLKAGREVAEFLGTDHHEFTFTVQVGRQWAQGLGFECGPGVEGFRCGGVPDFGGTLGRPL